MRLIDADELFNVINQDIKAFERLENTYYRNGVICGLAVAKMKIKIAPTIKPGCNVLIADPEKEKKAKEFFKMTAEDEKEISGLLEEGEE